MRLAASVVLARRSAHFSRVRANGFGNDVGLEVLEPGFCGADGGATMAARCYGAPDHGIFRPEMFRERVLQKGFGGSPPPSRLWNSFQKAPVLSGIPSLGTQCDCLGCVSDKARSVGVRCNDAILTRSR